MRDEASSIITDVNYVRTWIGKYAWRTLVYGRARARAPTSERVRVPEKTGTRRMRTLSNDEECTRSTSGACVPAHAYSRGSGIFASQILIPELI